LTQTSEHALRLMQQLVHPREDGPLMSGAPEGDSLNNVAYSLKILANFANLATHSPTDVAHGHALRLMK
jgi:hypothetical protein